MGIILLTKASRSASVSLCDSGTDFFHVGFVVLRSLMQVWKKKRLTIINLMDKAFCFTVLPIDPDYYVVENIDKKLTKLFQPVTIICRMKVSFHGFEKLFQIALSTRSTSQNRCYP